MAQFGCSTLEAADVDDVVEYNGTCVAPSEAGHDLLNRPCGTRYEFLPAGSVLCSFDSEIFCQVMLNLIRNPNITSSHLFRADIFYDSQNDVTYAPHFEDVFCTDHSPMSATMRPDDLSSFVKHMKPDYRPWCIHLDGFKLKRTIVRQLVPRNPKVDKPLVQTCHIFEQNEPLDEKTIVVYLPHVSDPADMPFYHPIVRALAFSYTRCRDDDPLLPAGTEINEHSRKISISISPFRSGLSPELGTSKRVKRTVLNLLSTIHKHGTGRSHGYVKRVQHDALVPQAAFQDRLTYLKGKYAQNLINSWCEQTDPVKHVFEDLGIAAFLIELWRDMYATDASGREDPVPRQASDSPLERPKKLEGEKPGFPGFVDIGCGNGVLVNILLQEGYRGLGIDARRRRSWGSFPDFVQDHLQERILVPSVFLREVQSKLPESGVLIHGGNFEGDTFIISNHADHLTTWTPLLAHLSGNLPFICIPCCSHSLEGTRFRARMRFAKHERGFEEGDTHPTETATAGSCQQRSSQKQPSAYATLCDYVARLTTEVGYEVEKESLRIPSTRSQAIVGRRRNTRSLHGARTPGQPPDEQQCPAQLVRDIVERELRKSVRQASEIWVENAVRITKGSADSH